MDFFREIPLDEFQAEAMARGLFAVAASDGVHEREAALVASFYEEAGGGTQSLAELQRRDAITGEELAAALPDEQQRRLFVKTALLLAWADGEVSAGEREVVTRFAGALGVAEEAIGQLENEVKEFLLSQLAGVRNVEAVTAVAKELDL